MVEIQGTQSNASAIESPVEEVGENAVHQQLGADSLVTPPPCDAAPLPDLPAEPEEELTAEEEALRDGEKNRLRLVKAIRKRLRNDKDAVVIVTGERGIGKSVCAWKLVKEINPSSVIDRNVLFDPQVTKLKDIIYGFPKYSATSVDELIRIGYRRNWFKQGNKLLVELYNLCRYQNQASILCIPNFNDIDSDLQDLVTFWIFVVNRGVCVVFRSDKNPFTADKWHMRDNEKLLRDEFKGKPLHYFTDSEFIRALERVPNFVCWFTFNDFTSEEKAFYNKLRVPYEMKDDEKVVATKAVRERIKKVELGLSEAILALHAEGYSLEKIEGLTGVARQRIGSMLKESKGGSFKVLTKGVRQKMKHLEMPV